MSHNHINVLGYPVSARGLLGDVNAAWMIVKSGESGRYVVCANPHSLMVARHDLAFSEALMNADTLLPDGAGIVLAARLLRLPLIERVAGSEFFLELTKLAQMNGGARYFFLGSSEHVLGRIAERMRREFPSINVCGIYSPPFQPEFTEEENKAMCEKVNNAKPDVLWVGMTAPKQEKWIRQNREYLNVPMIGAIGAVFDFYAGTKKRAPAWVCNLGFEWLPRLLREPRRLFRRNFISSPQFLFLVFQARLSQSFSRKKRR